ncbi:hypothetical protein N2152v2_004087 [Parachlorella kessleri]
MATLPPLMEPTEQPGSLEDCPCTWVQTAEQLETLALFLTTQQRFALDVEHHSIHTYAGITCLLQISTGSEDYLIDPLALSSSLCILGPVFSDPAICKVLHGGGNDVVWLQRDFGLRLVNIFDTEKACQASPPALAALGLQQRSLGWLLQRYCGVDADKSLQQADWRQRPLPEPLLRYARADVHYLLFIADCLGRELAQRDGLHSPVMTEQPGGSAEQGDSEVEGSESEGAGAGDDAATSGTTREARGHGSSNLLLRAAHGGLGNQAETSSSGLEDQAPRQQQAQLLAGTRFWHAVRRSQALSLSRHRPLAPRAAAEQAALAVMRRHVSELREAGRLERPESARLIARRSGSGEEALVAGLSSGSQTCSPGGSGSMATNNGGRTAGARLCLNNAERRELELVGDGVFALCEWRDAVARELDEGIQCVLPDPVLLHLARAPPLSPQQLHTHLLPFQTTYPTACAFPASVESQAATLVEFLREAADGQRPWVSAELAALAQAGAGGVVAAARRKHQDPAAFRERLTQRFSAKKAVYENCVMLSAAGEMLCHTDRKKLEWYLAKGIAVKVSDDPLTVQLTFQHKTTDQARGTSEYYQAAKNNKYRVVPSCYRRAMPVHLKSHRSHDVVLLCVTCHEVAHGAAEKLKRRIAAEYGIPLFPPIRQQPLPGEHAQQQGEQAQQQPQQLTDSTSTNGRMASNGLQAAEGDALPAHPYHARQAALALERHAHTMPTERRRFLEGLVLSFLGRSSSSPAGNLPAPAFTEADLLHGLLAGLSARTRRKLLRSWQAKGRQLPAELAAEAAETANGQAEAAAAAALDAEEPGSGAAEGGDSNTVAAADNETEGSEDASGVVTSEGSADKLGVRHRTGREGGGGAANTGHLWHGQQTVELIAAESGDAGLMQLCQRFRQAFVDALRPQHLPPGWQVDHTAARDFGDFSIYRKGG